MDVNTTPLCEEKGPITDELLQKMKAFSNTLSDIGVYSEGLDMVITAESSYPSADYFSRIEKQIASEIRRREKNNNNLL